MSAGETQHRFRTTRKVEFNHCDPAGIVFYPRYFEMLNSVAEEWFGERNGLSFPAMHQSVRRGVPTAKLDIRFTAPSRHGDVLEFVIEVLKVGGASLDIVTRCSGDGIQRFECHQTFVFIDLDTGKPLPWTEELRANLISQIGSGSPS